MTLTLICPACKQRLDLSSTSHAACTSCGRNYPKTLDIPDLRGSDAAMSKSETSIVKQMLTRYKESNCTELAEIRLRSETISSEVPDELMQHMRNYITIQTQRGRRMVEMFHTRLGQHFTVKGNKAALDVGCGSGASLVALSQRYEQVAGIDPSLPNLILARKTLETLGITNVQLIQSYGQHIPYPDGSFDYVNALNVLEHVFDLDGVLKEIHRALELNGGFAADSRNRFDLFLPEPHVKIRWVGILPRRWAKVYVRWRQDMPYESTYLLSYADLHRGLREYFDRRFRITFPHVSAYGSPAWVDPWLMRLEHIPLLRELALWVFPSHLVLAQR